MPITIVTGASSGLGQQIAQKLCNKGHVVYAVARSKNILKDMQKKHEKCMGSIIAFPGDLTDTKFREKLVSSVLKEEGKIDYLINNAGFGLFQEIEKQSIQQTKAMYQLNAIAYTHLIQLVLPKMKKKKRGRIINVSSIVSYTPLPYFATYDATKAAVTMLTRALSYELAGSGVSVSVVHPARMKTKFADRAFECHMETPDYKKCVKEFNKIAGSAEKVADYIVRNLDSKKVMLFPTFRARMLYTTRHFAGLIDYVNKKFMAPKAKEHL